MSEEAIKKRSEGHYKPVAQYTRNGEFIRIWDSVKDASIELGICDSQIASVCRGNTPKKTAGGFVFKYIKKDGDRKFHGVDSDEPMRYGSEPLAIIRRKEGEA